jgi:hypothetical protein
MGRLRLIFSRNPLIRTVTSPGLVVTPMAPKKSIPYSQALRLKRICCKPHKLSDRLHQLEGHLKARGYKHKSIKAAFERVRNTPREETLIYKKRDTSKRTTFPIRYHPNLRNLPGVVRDKYKNILLADQSNQTIFPEPPMVAYKRPQNLRDVITRARICRPIRSAASFQNCQSSECSLHNHTVTGNTFTSAATNQTYQIKHNLDCKSHNVIYLASCTKPGCGQQYVGETGRELIVRADEHLTDIRKQRATPVAVHFRSFGHNAEHFSIQAIEKCNFNSTTYRKTKESFWIKKLKPTINKQYVPQIKFSNLRTKFQKGTNKLKRHCRRQRR